ncbi:oligoribonuclease [Klebsiella pneumoniae]|nr:oligoribonuclease [Klebsiella pneumoniae]
MKTTSFGSILEMTGLDPERDRIIEIATLVTDANLNISG